MKEKVKILMVEDDMNFGSVLKSYLEINEFQVEWISDGRNALAMFKKQKFDICLLDVMLPHVDGFTIAEQFVMENPDVPFIFLTAKSLKEDISKGYKLGADDYITKPFDSDVLIMKINAVLKRNQGHKPFLNIDKDEYQVGIFYFLYSERILKNTENEEKRILSPKESQLLKLLCDNQESVLSREHALNTIWGNDGYYTTRSMDVYLTKLRKYLSSDEKIQIINIHGSGYVLKLKKDS